MKQRLLLLGYVVLLSIHLLGQSGFRFTPLSVNEGLNQSSVNAIAEDEFGFIWFGTQEGLARFDGRNFTVYRAGFGEKQLTDDFITAIAASSDSGLWVGTSHGLNYVKPGGSEILQMNSADDRIAWSAGHINQVASKNNVALVHCFGQAFTVIREGQELRAGHHWNSKSVSSVGVYNNEFIVADSSHVLWIWHDDGSRTEFKKLDFAPEGMRSFNRHLVYWHENQLQLVYEKTVATYCTQAVITDVVFENDRVWVTTENGLEFIENTPFKVEVFDRKAAPLSTDKIMCATPLKNGTIAFGTQRYGAFFWNKQSLAFQHLPGHLFADPIIWSAVLTGDELFVGSTKGLDLFRVKNEQLDAVTLRPESNFEIVYRWTNFHPCALLREGDSLWVGTTDRQVLLLEKKENQWLQTAAFQFSDAHKFYSIDQTETGDLAIASNKGLFVGLPGEQIDSLYLDEISTDPTVSRYCHHVLNHQDDVWVSSTSGLYRYRLSNHTLTHLKPEKKAGSIPSANVASCAFSTNGSMFVATLGSGFSMRSADATDFTTFGIDNGLVNDYIYGFVEGQQGIWGSCNEGAFLFSKGQIQSFTSKSGIPFLEHSQNAFGTMHNMPWFGGIDGLYLINESQLAENPSPSNLIFTEVLVNYAPLTEASGSKIQGSHFDLSQVDLIDANNLSLGIAIPGLAEHTQVISYRLDRQEWIQLPSLSDRIHFSSLSDGNHLLEIGVGRKTGEVSMIKRVPITVHPPFWKKPWFIICMALLLTLIVAAVLTTRNKRILKEERLKREAFERVKNERERISMDLHDNIGAQITHVITSLDNLSYKLGENLPESSLHAVEGLSDFARGTMQQLRDTIWTMNKEHIEMDDFIARVQDYLGRILAEVPRPRFIIKNNSSINPTINPELAIQLFRVIQEATSNTLKHADASLLQIDFDVTEDQLTFTYADDGVGFETDVALSDHYGIRNMVTRINGLSGTIELQSAAGRGSKVTVSVPLK